MDWETPRDDRQGMRSEDPRVGARIRGRRQFSRPGRRRPSSRRARCSADRRPRRRRPTDEARRRDAHSRSGSTRSTSPGSRSTAIPVNPTDPIAIVNGQVITRQQLADECVARKGKEILETLINRTLIEQALKAPEAGGHGGRDRPGDRQRRAPVRHRPRGLAADAGQGARDQPRPVRPRHHLPRPGPPQALHRAGHRDAQGPARTPSNRSTATSSGAG